jgi:hypothetical protein
MPSAYSMGWRKPKAEAHEINGSEINSMKHASTKMSTE